jgi:hypothetical protein
MPAPVDAAIFAPRLLLKTKVQTLTRLRSLAGVRGRLRTAWAPLLAPAVAILVGLCLGVLLFMLAG